MLNCFIEDHKTNILNIYYFTLYMGIAHSIAKDNC